jgi:Tol biopolymer transport system component
LLRPGLTLVVILVVLVLAGCREDQTAPSPFDGAEATSSEAPEVSVDRIIYVSPEGDLNTIKPDGSSPQRLTGGTQLRAGPDVPAFSQVGEALPIQSADFNNFYAWPTWSPDATRLAASRLQVSDGQELQVSVQIINATNGRAENVFTNEIPALIADGVPHYLSWSPEGKYLAVLSSTPRGLTLFVVDTQSSDGPVAVETGAPLYFSWAADGGSMLIHVGPEVRLVESPFETSTQKLLATTGGFRVPAFSPDGRRLAYPIFPNSSEPGGSLIISGTDDPGSPEPVLDLEDFAAFLWSPSGDALAVADRADNSATIFQRLRVVSADGRSVHTITEEQFVAFYWSPDGELIAWVALVPEERMFQWKVASRQGQEMRELFRYHPSGDTFTMLSFFDQYAYSHSPWSPDSSRLVVTGSPEASFERRNGQTPTGSRVFVLDVAGDAPAHDIAAGTLAFWSGN